MAWQIAKVAIAAVMIGFSSWLAGREPRLAGFLIALPLSSILALALFHAEYRDLPKAVTFAKSIVLAVPLSLVFFIPFLFAERLGFGFWTLFSLGVALLGVGYLIHSILVGA